MIENEIRAVISDTPNQSEVNAVVRTLTDKRLRFTGRLHHPRLGLFEFQSAKIPAVEWDSDLRRMVLRAYSADDKYNSAYVVCDWDSSCLLGVEENL